MNRTQSQLASKRKIASGVQESIVPKFAMHSGMYTYLLVGRW